MSLKATVLTLFPSWQVKGLISSDAFWRQAQGLCKLLSSLTHALAGIKAKEFTLADVTLCWLRLATALQYAARGPSLPVGERFCLYIVLNVYALHRLQMRLKQLRACLCRQAKHVNALLTLMHHRLLL